MESLPGDILRYMTTFLPPLYWDYLRFVSPRLRHLLLPRSRGNIGDLMDSPELFHWARDKKSPGSFPEMCYQAVKKKRWEILEWLYNTYREGSYILYSAIKFNDQKIIEWTLERLSYLRPRYERSVQIDGRTIIDLMHEKLYGPCYERCIQIAARYGHVDIADRFITYSWSGHTICLYSAIRNGQIGILTKHARYLENMNRDRLYLVAAEGGRLSVLDFLVMHIPLGFNVRNIYITGARLGHLYVIKWAREHGIEFDSYAYGVAAKKGHMHILQYFYDQNWEYPQSVISSAIASGKLEVVQMVYSHQTRIKFNLRRMLKKAKNHRFQDIVRWIETLF